MRRLTGVVALFLFVGVAEAQPTPWGAAPAPAEPGAPAAAPAGETPPPAATPAGEPAAVEAGDEGPTLTADELVAAALAGGTRADAGVAVDAGPEPTARSGKRPRAKRQTAAEPESSYLWEFLGVCVLLGLWLLARWQKRSQSAAHEVRTPPPPSAPRRPEELGWAIFNSVREDNLDQFRGLFLKGPEAVRVLGPEEAAAYLEHRSLGKLREALDRLTVRIPPDGTYAGCELFADGGCELVVDVGGEEALRVPVGTVDEIDGILRLREAGR